MKSQTVKLPAFLASALINGDTSGLECSCAEIAAEGSGKPSKRLKTTHRKGCDHYWLAAAMAYVAPGEIVSSACTCDASGSEDPEVECTCESYFSWSCDLLGFNLGADMLDYVVLYPD